MIKTARESSMCLNLKKEGTIRKLHKAFRSGLNYESQIRLTEREKIDLLEIVKYI